MSNSRHVQFYEDDQGEWRWRALAGNGKIVADSSEGYRTHAAAVEAFNRAVDVMVSAKSQRALY